MKKRGDISQNTFAILVITLVIVIALATILWPRIRLLGSQKIPLCSPCGEEMVKIEATNYQRSLAAGQNLFDGVRVRLCNCRDEKVSLSGAEISYGVELPEGKTIGSGAFSLPKNKEGGLIVPGLEPQEGVKFDWDKMAAGTEVPVIEESVSGKVTLKLLLDGRTESDYIWQVFYSPLCPGTCRSWTGFYCYPTETEIGALNCQSGERCCK